MASAIYPLFRYSIMRRKKQVSLWLIFLALLAGFCAAVVYQQIKKNEEKSSAPPLVVWQVEPWETGVVTSTPARAHRNFEKTEFLFISFVSNVTKREYLGIIDPQIADIGDWAPGDKVKVGRLVRPRDNPPYADPVLIGFVITARIEQSTICFENRMVAPCGFYIIDWQPKAGK